MLLVSVIIASVFCATNVVAIDITPRADVLFKNNLTVSYQWSPIEIWKIFNTTYTNEGDLIWEQEGGNNGTLQYSEIFVNPINRTTDQAWKMTVNKTPLNITAVRIMNIGRQFAIEPELSIVRIDGQSKVEAKFNIHKNEQARVWIEIFGTNGSSHLSSSWLLISISTLLYCIYNKH